MIRTMFGRSLAPQPARASGRATSRTTRLSKTVGIVASPPIPVKPAPRKARTDPGRARPESNLNGRALYLSRRCGDRPSEVEDPAVLDRPRAAGENDPPEHRPSRVIRRDSVARSPFPPDPAGDYPEIVTPLPGPRARECIARDARTVSQNLSKDVPLVAARAQGMVVEDVDGNRFLDFAAGISTVSTGHCHPEVVKAVQEQAAKLIHICYTDFYYPVYIDLCETLARLAPITGEKRVFLTNSGAEAVETAIKLARLRTGRQKVIGFFGAFHGRTYGAMTLTASKPVQRKGYGPFVPEILHTHYAYCYRCPVNRDPASCSVECLELLTESYFHHSVDPEEVAAVIVEPVQGEGGFIPPHKYFLPRLR